MKTCAVIVAARRAGDWINDCLDSVLCQEPLEGWAFATRVGIDACEETTRALVSAQRPHWSSLVHVGPYLMRNSLIGLSRADAYAIFDADDVMAPHYLKTLIPMLGFDGIAGGARVNMTVAGQPYGNLRFFRNGVAVFSAGAWSRLGGYRAWPFAADHDLMERAHAIGIPVYSHEDGPLFYRRIHSDSLTAAPETGIRSARRRALKDASHSLIAAGLPLRIEPETVPLNRMSKHWAK